MLWLKKHEPKNLSEFPWFYRRNIETIFKWFDNATKELEQKPLVIFGETGIGKTTFIKLLAKKKKLGFISYPQLELLPPPALASGEVICHISEHDASALFTILNSKYLSEKVKKLNVIIEISTSSKNINSLLKRTVTIREFSEDCLRQNFVIVYLEKPFISDVEKLLRKICERERIKVSDKLLYEIAKTCRGDLRKAIQLLELTSRFHHPINLVDQMKQKSSEFISYYLKEAIIFLQQTKDQSLIETPELTEISNECMLMLLIENKLRRSSKFGSVEYQIRTFNIHRAYSEELMKSLIKLTNNRISILSKILEFIQYVIKQPG